MENEEKNATAIPSGAEVTTPNQNEFTVPVKFNKEVKNLSVEEASVLSQKGMKFDSIKNELDMLKNLAEKSGQSIGEYLADLENARTQKEAEKLVESFGGDVNAAKEALKKNEENKEIGLKGENEIEEFFPGMKREDLPEEVVASALLKNRNVVDEYLRYKEKNLLILENLKRKKAENEFHDAGSLKSTESDDESQNNEFIKGLWGN